MSAAQSASRHRPDPALILLFLFGAQFRSAAPFSSTESGSSPAPKLLAEPSTPRAGVAARSPFFARAVGAAK
jgi:hypothetical protein